MADVQGMTAEKGQRVTYKAANEADTMSFEELLACPHLQFSLDTEILPHLLAFGPPAAAIAPATVFRLAKERRRWMFTPVMDTTVTR